MTRMPDPGLVIALSAGPLTRSDRLTTAPNTPSSARLLLPITYHRVPQQRCGIVPATRSTAMNRPNVCGNGSSKATGPRDERWRWRRLRPRSWPACWTSWQACTAVKAWGHLPGSFPRSWTVGCATRADGLYRGARSGAPTACTAVVMIARIRQRTGRSEAQWLLIATPQVLSAIATTNRCRANARVEGCRGRS